MSHLRYKSSLTPRQLSNFSVKILDFQTYLQNNIRKFDVDNLTPVQTKFINDIYDIIGGIDQIVEDFTLSDVTTYGGTAFLIRNM